MSFSARGLALALTVFTTAASAQTTPASTPVVPFKASDRYFFAGANGALYVRDGRAAKPRLILHPGRYGTTLAPSPSGKYLAYTEPGSGTAGATIKIRDLDTGRDLSDVLPHATMSESPWTRNNRGLFYVRVDSVQKRQRIYYHLIGTPPANDRVVFSRPDAPDWMYDARVTDDGVYVILTISHPIDDHTRMYFIDLDNPGKPSLSAPVVKLIDTFGARYAFIDNGGTSFFLWTDREAPNGRLVLSNTQIIRETRWPPVITESRDTLQLVRTAGNEYIVAVHHNGTRTMARVYTPADEFRASAQRRGGQRGGQGGGRPPRGARPDSDSTIAYTPPRGMPGDTIRPMRRDDAFGFRLALRSEIPLPGGAKIIDMRSIAHDDELFYTIRKTDGTTEAFVYNVKTGRNEPVDTRIP